MNFARLATRPVDDWCVSLTEPFPVAPYNSCGYYMSAISPSFELFRFFVTRGLGLACFLVGMLPSPLLAELAMHGTFGENMVLQRDKPIPVWGTTEPGKNVIVVFHEQSARTTADAQGNWSVELPAMEADSEGQTLVVEAGEERIAIDNVLLGDIWLCGGQSNMEFDLAKIYQGDVEIASANLPQIRLMTVPANATPQRLSNIEALNEFNAWSNRYEQKGDWHVCSPETVPKFAAIGYIFARRLHLASGVPIGIIDNSVGGTTVEGWTSRESLGNIPAAAGLLEQWDEKIDQWDPEADLARRVERWERETEQRNERGQKPSPKPTDFLPGPAFDRNNPGASYNAMLAPLSGMRIRGIIFHQGYNNALGDSRPHLYAETIQAMIGDWRAAFEEPELPFGIIELCAGADPQTKDDFEVRMVDAGPFIREAQFRAFRELPNMGWAGAYDQQVNWYHPQQKVALGERMARWALATQYELPLGHQPAVLVEHQISDQKINLTFDRPLTVRDGRPIEGMAIAGQDGRFYPATATFTVTRKDDRGRDVYDYRKIDVSHPLVKEPIAVRYAWARCPLGNLTNRESMERTLPVPSFRTDDWDWPDAPFGDDRGATRRQINQWRQEARRNAADRKIQEARLILEAEKSDQ